MKVGDRFGTVVQIEIASIEPRLSARIVRSSRHWSALGFREGLLIRLDPTGMPGMWRTASDVWFLLDEQDGTFEHYR